MEEIIEILKGRFKVQAPLLLAISADKFIFYNVSNSCMKNFPKGHKLDRKSQITIPINSRETIICSSENGIYSLEPSSGRLVKIYKTVYYISGIKIQYPLLALLTYEGEIHLFDFIKHKIMQKIRVGYYKKLVYHESISTIFLISNLGFSTVDSKTLKRKEFEYQTRYLEDLTPIPNSNKFITLEYDKIQIWSDKPEGIIKCDQGESFISATVLTRGRIAGVIERSNKKFIVRVYDNSENFPILYSSVEIVHDLYPKIIVEVPEKNKLLVSFRPRGCRFPGYKIFEFDLSSKKVEELFFAELIDDIIPIQNLSKRIMKLILLSRLQLPKDLINEVLNFFDEE